MTTMLTVIQVWWTFHQKKCTIFDFSPKKHGAAYLSETWLSIVFLHPRPLWTPPSSRRLRQHHVQIISPTTRRLVVTVPLAGVKALKIWQLTKSWGELFCRTHTIFDISWSLIPKHQAKPVRTSGDSSRDLLIPQLEVKLSKLVPKTIPKRSPAELPVPDGYTLMFQRGLCLDPDFCDFPGARNAGNHPIASSECGTFRGPCEVGCGMLWSCPLEFCWSWPLRSDTYRKKWRSKCI